MYQPDGKLLPVTIKA